MTTYAFWIIFRPAADIPGQWVAHNLDLDVVTQGDSLTHAILMAQEATEMVLVDDIAAGRDLMDRRAPGKHWDDMWKTIRGKDSVPLRGNLAAEMKKRGDLKWLVGQFSFAVEATTAKKKRRSAQVEMPFAMAAGHTEQHAH